MPLSRGGSAFTVTYLTLAMTTVKAQFQENECSFTYMAAFSGNMHTRVHVRCIRGMASVRFFAGPAIDVSCCCPAQSLEPCGALATQPPTFGPTPGPTSEPTAVPSTAASLLGGGPCYVNASGAPTGGCGPQCGAHRCRSPTSPFCNEMNGFCGSTGGHRDAQESDQYDYSEDAQGDASDSDAGSPAANQTSTTSPLISSSSADGPHSGDDVDGVDSTTTGPDGQSFTSGTPSTSQPQPPIDGDADSASSSGTHRNATALWIVVGGLAAAVMVAVGIVLRRRCERSKVRLASVTQHSAESESRLELQSNVASVTVNPTFSHPQPAAGAGAGAAAVTGAAGAAGAAAGLRIRSDSADYLVPVPITQRNDQTLDAEVVFEDTASVGSGPVHAIPAATDQVIVCTIPMTDIGDSELPTESSDDADFPEARSNKAVGSNTDTPLSPLTTESGLHYALFQSGGLVLAAEGGVPGAGCEGVYAVPASDASGARLSSGAHADAHATAAAVTADARGDPDGIATGVGSNPGPAPPGHDDESLLYDEVQRRRPSRPPAVDASHLRWAPPRVNG